MTTRGRPAQRRRKPHRLRPDAPQGGRSVPPRRGQLRRRRQPARHAAQRDPAQPVRARQHRVGRHLGGRGAAGRARGHHRRDARPGSAWRGCRPCPTTPRPCSPPTRCASRARRSRSSSPTAKYIARDALELIDVDYEPLPPVMDAKKAMDAAAPVIRDDKEGQTNNFIYDWESGNKEETEAAFAAAEVVVDRGHPLPARAPGADGDVRLGGAHGPGDRQAHALDHHPGTARSPHGLRAGRRAARAEDPGDQPRHRRRLRQQGADLPRLRLLGRRLHRHRQAGEVDGGPQREPHVDRVRPRLPHEGVHRLDARGQDPRGEGRRPRRPRRVQQRRAADEVPGRLLPHLHRLLRLPGGALHRARGLHEQGARRCRLRLLVPHHRGRVRDRADRRLPGGRARDGSGRAAVEEPAASRAVPVHHAHGLGVRLGRLREDDARRDGHRRLRRAASRAGGEARQGRVHGHRHLVLHRGCRRRPAQAHGHPRPRHGRRLRPARAPDRQGAGADLGPDPGPGPRDDVRADRQPRTRDPARGHRGDSRRHRQHPVRPGHLRVALNAGVRCGGGGRRATGARQGAADRGGGARVLARRPRVGARPLVRQGRPGARPDDPGDRDGRPRSRSSCPRASRVTSTRRSSTTRRTSPTRTAATSASSTWTRAPDRSRCDGSSRSTTAACASTR